MKNNKNSLGFSLIELSIVLIIMGLLIAGVTGGASLIRSAEMRSEIASLRDIQTSVNAFYTSLGYLPASESSSNMDFANSADAFNAMNTEGVYDVKISSTGAVTNFSKENSPSAKIKGAFYALGYNDQMKSNVIFIISGGATSSENDTPTTLKEASNKVEVSEGEEEGTIKKVKFASLTRKNAKFLDEKIDNGIPNSGKLYSFSADDAGNEKCSNEDAYVANDTSKSCAVAYQLGL